MRSGELEKILWSVALPGFGQLLNKKYFKGILLITLEILVNLKSRLNEIIILSFHGEIEQAIEITDFQWLLFYPCLYMFAIWDAHSDALLNRKILISLRFLPYVMSAFCGTVGVIYSTNLRLAGVLLGPVWLPMIFSLIAICISFPLRKLLRIWIYPDVDNRNS